MDFGLYDDKIEKQLDVILKAVLRCHHRNGNRCKIPADNSNFIHVRYVLLLISAEKKTDEQTFYHQIVIAIDRQSLNQGDKKTVNALPENPYFIDIHGRIYKRWTKFLLRNELPPGQMCYPKRGCYDEKMTLEFGRTCKFPRIRKAIRVADIAGAIVGLTGLGLAVGSLFLPPLAIAVLGCTVAGGVFGTTRSVSRLVDRRKHGQTIAIQNPDARRCYLLIAACVGGLAAAGVAAHLANVARAGQVAAPVVLAGSNAVFASAAVASGASLANSGLSIVGKFGNDEPIGALEIAQLTVSLLLFGNFAINYRTAEGLLEYVQNQTIAQHRLALSEANIATAENLRAAFQVENGTVDGNALVIRTFHHAQNDLPTLFENLERHFGDAIRTPENANKDPNGLSLGKNETVQIDFKNGIFHKETIYGLSISNDATTKMFANTAPEAISHAGGSQFGIKIGYAEIHNIDLRTGGFSEHRGIDVSANPDVSARIAEIGNVLLEKGKEAMKTIGIVTAIA